MKTLKLKLFSIIAIILICLSLSSCADEPEEEYTKGNGITVYVTAFGEKYHRASCRYLKNSKKAIDLEEALSRGYGRCSVCKPPTE